MTEEQAAALQRIERTAHAASAGLDNPDEPLQCVFSTINEMKVGTGNTTKMQRSKRLWYIEQKDADAFAVRKINPQFVPVGDEEIISREALLDAYLPEVEILNEQVRPAMLDLRKTIAKGDKHREKHEPFSAEMEYTKALDVDETNVRAIFGLGLVYLEKGDNENARLVFHQLVETKGAFAAKHKHLFNDFGIALRKGGLYVEAAQYYSRALELTDKDENLFYNLARAHYEQFHWQRAADSLARALLLDEEHKPSRDLCRFMIALSKDETLREKHDKPPVPEEVAERLAGLISQAQLAGASHVEPQQV